MKRESTCLKGKAHLCQDCACSCAESQVELDRLRAINAELREALSGTLGFVVAVKIAGQKEYINVPPPYSLESKIRAAIARAEQEIGK